MADQRKLIFLQEIMDPLRKWEGEAIFFHGLILAEIKNLNISMKKDEILRAFLENLDLYIFFQKIHKTWIKII